jgi:predicted nucleotidyltransferase
MEINHKKLEKEAQKLGIRMVILFGSQACDKARPDSDYDIAVLTSSEKNIGDNLDNYNAVLTFLCDVFKIREDKADITNLNNSSPFLSYEIARNSRLIYGDESMFASFKASAMREYIATKDLRDLEEILIHKRQNLLAKKIYA